MPYSNSVGLCIRIGLYWHWSFLMCVLCSHFRLGTLVVELLAEHYLFRQAKLTVAVHLSSFLLCNAYPQDV